MRAVTGPAARSALGVVRARRQAARRRAGGRRPRRMRSSWLGHARIDTALSAAGDNSLTTVVAPDASDESAKPRETDDPDAGGRIGTLSARFRSVSGQPGGGSSPLIRITSHLWLGGAETANAAINAVRRSCRFPGQTRFESPCLWLECARCIRGKTGVGRAFVGAPAFRPQRARGGLGLGRSHLGETGSALEPAERALHGRAASALRPEARRPRASDKVRARAG